MARPYSFRYPFDIQTTLSPWRNFFGLMFDPVITILRDRDRALEDYLTLGIGQGYLARAEVTTSQVGIGAPQTQITGTLKTITVPAGRLLRFDVHLIVDNQAAGVAVATMQIREGTVVAGSTLLSSRGVGLEATGSIQDFADYGWSHFIAPTAGEHSYFLSVGFSSGNGDVVSTGSTAPTLFSITDAGPAN